MAIRVLFLCTGNSARSQIAEGLLRHVGGELFDVQSAGTNPRPEVHPKAVEAMADYGFDIRAQAPKDVKRFAEQAFDYVITLCDRATESCPSLPGAEPIHWSFSDPAAVVGDDAQARAFHKLVRELRARIDLLNAVAPSAPVPKSAQWTTDVAGVRPGSRRTGLLVAAASLAAVGVTWWAVSAGTSPHADEPSDELVRALDRAVPARATTISLPSYETRASSVTGVTEFELRLSWEEYRAWLATAFSVGWRSQDGGPDGVVYTRYVPGDAYRVSVQRVHDAPLRVRATAVGQPD